jgi:hypothetical protein
MANLSIGRMVEAISDVELVPRPDLGVFVQVVALLRLQSEVARFMDQQDTALLSLAKQLLTPRSAVQAGLAEWDIDQLMLQWLAEVENLLTSAVPGDVDRHYFGRHVADAVYEHCRFRGRRRRGLDEAIRTKAWYRFVSAQLTCSSADAVANMLRFVFPHELEALQCSTGEHRAHLRAKALEGCPGDDTNLFRLYRDGRTSPQRPMLMQVEDRVPGSLEFFRSGPHRLFEAMFGKPLAWRDWPQLEATLEIRSDPMPSWQDDWALTKFESGETADFPRFSDFVELVASFRLYVETSELCLLDDVPFFEICWLAVRHSPVVIEELERWGIREDVAIWLGRMQHRRLLHDRRLREQIHARWRPDDADTVAQYVADPIEFMLFRAPFEEDQALIDQVLTQVHLPSGAGAENLR